MALLSHTPKKDKVADDNMAGDKPTEEMPSTAKNDILLLSREAMKELELQEQSLPDRWLDFFCIVGVDPESGQKEAKHKPILLDRYPKEDRAEMEFPVHLPTFCFPDGGCHLQERTLRQKITDDTTALSKNRQKYHHNVPDPFLCSMVLTSGSGHRLYCTSLTVYEMIEDTERNQEEKRKQERDRAKEEEAKRKKKEELEKKPPMPKFDKNWWEEPDTKARQKTLENLRKAVKAAPKFKEEHYLMVPKCLVLISHYPFFQAQSTALKELFYTVQSGESPVPFERYVAHLVDDLPLPRSGIKREGSRHSHTIVEWRSWTKPLVMMKSNIRPTIRLERSPPNKLPLLNISMEPLFRTLSLSNILVIWATLLQEGKVVLACSNSETVSLLTPIAEALMALLFPLEWQGIYVPVLPNHDSVLDMLEAPVPYLIGLVTKPSSQYVYSPQTHPNGVLWCDLDNDILHLGFKGDRIFYNQNDQSQEEVPLLPALPTEASMTLKTELEEFADPLYLPTIEGVKGRITIGDRTHELHNRRRQPYAPSTKLFDGSIASPRKYILTQTSKIPPRGKPLSYEDFSMVANTKKEKYRDDGSTVGTQTDEDEAQISLYEDEDKEDSDMEEHSMSPNANQETVFFTTFKRRSVQAHVDRAMAVLGQDYATPSKYAKRQFGEDLLSKQDEIAAELFSTDKRKARRLTEKVRECFLRFFLSTFAEYKTYFDSENNRLDEEQFVTSLNLSYDQQDYIKEVVNSQMFEIFLQDLRSIKNRKLFDEFVIKYNEGAFSLGRKKGSGRSYGTPLLDSSQWQNPTIITTEQPCSIGLKKGITYCSDRRFPDSLNPDECITNGTASFWNVFCCCI